MDRLLNQGGSIAGVIREGHCQESSACAALTPLGPAPYHVACHGSSSPDPVRPIVTTIFILLGMVVSGVWIWKRLSPDAQDLILDQALPLACDDDCVCRRLGAGRKASRAASAEIRDRTRLITFVRETDRGREAPQGGVRP